MIQLEKKTVLNNYVKAGDAKQPYNMPTAVRKFGADTEKPEEGA